MWAWTRLGQLLQLRMTPEEQRRRVVRDVVELAVAAVAAYRRGGLRALERLLARAGLFMGQRAINLYFTRQLRIKDRSRVPPHARLTWKFFVKAPSRLAGGRRALEFELQTHDGTVAFGPELPQPRVSYQYLYGGSVVLPLPALILEFYAEWNRRGPRQLEGLYARLR